MFGSGNTTVPADLDDSWDLPSSPTLAFGLVICHSSHEANREGQVAIVDPSRPGPWIVGRGVFSDSRTLSFVEQRPGERIPCGPLTGANLSKRQLLVTIEGDALRIHNIGWCTLFVDGVLVPQDRSVLVGAGAVLDLRGNCVLVVDRRPAELPALSPALLPLHPYGDADRTGIVGESPAAWALRAWSLFVAGVVEAPSDADRRADIGLLVRSLLMNLAEEKPALAAPFLAYGAGGRAYALVDSSLIVGLLRGSLWGNVREIRRILLMAIGQAEGIAPLRWPRSLGDAEPARLELRREETTGEIDDGLARLGGVPESATTRQARLHA
jgi:hypothetical protein